MQMGIILGVAIMEIGNGLAPVVRETVQDRVYDELRRALIAGRFTPGQVLTIRQLADALRTSTMPVRDALSRLISEHALEATTNRQIRVPLLSTLLIEDVLAARILIEGAAIMMAAARITPQRLSGIKTILTQWQDTRFGGSAEVVAREVTLNHAFHFEIYRTAKTAVLLPMIESLWLQSGPMIRAAAIGLADEGARGAARDHHEVMRALAAGDGKAAQAALIADISRPFIYLREKIVLERA